MADDNTITLETLQKDWTPEQKTFFETHVKTASETAVSTFKTQAEEEAKNRVPAKYELKLKDGSRLDPQGDVEKIVSFAKERRLSAEDAQKLLDSHHEVASGLATRIETEFADTVKAWETEVANDKTLGGENKLKTDQSLKLAIDKFDKDGKLKAFLEETKFGSHPEIVRFLARIGDALKEDGPNGLKVKPPEGKPKKQEQILYPTMQHA